MMVFKKLVSVDKRCGSERIFFMHDPDHGGEKSQKELTAELESCRRQIRKLEKSETALRERQKTQGERAEHLRLITSNMTDVIVMLDREGMHRFISPSYETVTGYTPDEVRNRPAVAFVHPDDMRTVQEALMKCRRTLTPGKVDYRYRRADGEYLWLETVGKPVFDKEGRFAGAVLCSRDITARKMMEEASSFRKKNTVIWWKRSMKSFTKRTKKVS